MSKGKLANHYGYTLIELIMTTAIITVISAVAIPNYTRYIESTREKVCIMNRQTILCEYHLYCISEQEITLSDYLKLYYAEDENHLCPSGGSYTASDSGDIAKLTCSVHPDTIAEPDIEPLKNLP